MSISMQEILGYAGGLLDRVLEAVHEGEFVAAVAATREAATLIDLVLQHEHEENDPASESGKGWAKRALVEQVVLPLTLSKSLRSKLLCGIRAGSGNVLLYGPPGTGKTLLAQAAARESGARFFAVRPSSILSKWQGESESKLRSVFDEARAAKRSIIFFDEFDSIATSRGGADDGAQARRLLSELLMLMTETKQQSAIDEKEEQRLYREEQAEIDMDAARSDGTSLDEGDGEGEGEGEGSVYTPPPGKRSSSSGSGSPRGADLGADLYEEDLRSTRTSSGGDGGGGGGDGDGEVQSDYSDLGGGVVVIAATNRIDDLDDAVIRRFSSRVYVGLPDAEARLLLLHKFLIGIGNSLSEQDFSSLVAQTHEWSGADIEFLVREAAMGPVRRLLHGGGSQSHLDSGRYEVVPDVTVEDFAEASEHLLQVDEDTSA